MKHRRKGLIRKSVSAKLNIMIVMIILIVAGLLMIISSRAYRRAVFRPLEQKLDNLEVAEDAFVPVSNHFSKVFQTDGFQEAKIKKQIRRTGRQSERLDDLPAILLSRNGQPVSRLAQCVDGGGLSVGVRRHGVTFCRVEQRTG